MSILEWAQNEVAFACKQILEDPEAPELIDYAIGCHQSALKAFETLCGQGHSGQSIQYVKEIFDRLVDGRCLTPVEDKEDQWHFAFNNTYQHNRMSSLFKTINPDGSVRYSDNNRVVTYDIDQKLSFHMGLSSKLIDEMFPITFPYYPSRTPYKVHRKASSVNPNHGDYDTIAILHVTTPEGEVVKICRYFTESDNRVMEEIDFKRYLELTKFVGAEE